MLTVCVTVSIFFCKESSDLEFRLNEVFSIKFPPYPFTGALFSSLKLLIIFLSNVVLIIFVLPEQVSSKVVLFLNISSAASITVIFCCFE